MSFAARRTHELRWSVTTAPNPRSPGASSPPDAVSATSASQASAPRTLWGELWIPFDTVAASVYSDPTYSIEQPSTGRWSVRPDRNPQRTETRLKTITKKELVNRIAEQTGVTKVVAKDIIQTFLNAIIQELADGNRLEFREFGVFESRERAARRAQNPRTLEKVDVPAKRIVKFKVGRLMRKRVSGELATGELPHDDD